MTTHILKPTQTAAFSFTGRGSGGQNHRATGTGTLVGHLPLAASLTQLILLSHSHWILNPHASASKLLIHYETRKIKRNNSFRINFFRKCSIHHSADHWTNVFFTKWQKIPSLTLSKEQIKLQTWNQQTNKHVLDTSQLLSNLFSLNVPSIFNFYVDFALNLICLSYLKNGKHWKYLFLLLPYYKHTPSVIPCRSRKEFPSGTKFYH